MNQCKVGVYKIAPATPGLLIMLDQILATAKIPGKWKAEEGGGNQFKVIPRLNSPDRLNKN